MIDGFKRNSTIYVGDSIVRFTIDRGGMLLFVTGSENRACDRKCRADHGDRKWRVHTGIHPNEQCGLGRN